MQTLQQHVAFELFFFNATEKNGRARIWGSWAVSLNLFEALFKNGCVSFMSDCLHVEFSPHHPTHPPLNFFDMTELIYRISVYLGNNSTSKLSSMLLIMMLKISCYELFLLGVVK